MSILKGQELELTEELMKEIVEQKKWSTIESLRELKKIGAKWNVERSTLVFDDVAF
jgi:hypothetical protein